MTAAIVETPSSSLLIQSGLVPDLAPHAAPAKNPHFDRRKSILIFDKDRNRAEARASRLRLDGIDVRCAATPNHALDCLDQQPCDLLLIDARKDPNAARCFCASVKRINPAQRVAFYVDGPKCISWFATDAMPHKTTSRGGPAANMPALLGTPQAPKKGSLLDASWRISVNHRLAAVKPQPGKLSTDGRQPRC